MKINLFDIPEDGREFVWNSNTGELNSVLQDLIGKDNYEAQIFIKPINSKDFEMTGSIKTKTKEDCSRCGIDFQFPVSEKIHEILIPPQPQDRQGKYARVNHISESVTEGPTVSEYNSQGFFDIGEHLHEVIAIAVPFNPAPAEDAKGNCTGCKLKVADLVFNYDEKMPESESPKPFEVLKNLKLQ